MLESFLVAFNAVAPFLILLGIGFAAVRLKWTDRPFMDRLNALNYKLFFPFLMFNNVYSAKPENMPSVKLMLTGALSVSLLVVLLVLIVPKIVKENSRRGVVIQGIFRSNFIIYGIPLTTYVFGTEKSSISRAALSACFFTCCRSGFRLSLPRLSPPWRGRRRRLHWWCWART